MKAKAITCCLFLGLFLFGCGGQVQPTITPVQPTATSIPASVTPEPTKTVVPPTATSIPASVTPEPTKTVVSPTATLFQLSTDNLPDTVEVAGDRVTFKEWGFFAVELPADTWEFNPKLYNKDIDFEGFGFERKEILVDSTGSGCSPTVSVMFYSVPEGMELIIFSGLLRGHFGENFPTIDSMFGYEGYEGPEPKFKIPVLGYYGHLGGGNDYSVYAVHAVKGTVGVQVSFEVLDSVLDQAEPEFFEIMQSLEFSQ